MNQWIKTGWLLVLSVILTRLIPFSSLFRNVNTLIHEFGHALMTLLLSGKVLRIELYADHSGVTYSSLPSKWSMIAVSLAGYTIASLFAWLMFYLYKRRQLAVGLGLLTLVALLTLILYVRGTFGIVWLLGFIALNIIMIFIKKEKLTKFYYLLISFIVLEESVVSSFILVTIALSNPAKAGDAANLAQYTAIPAIGWAGVFLVFALWCANGALSTLFRKERQAGTSIQE